MPSIVPINEESGSPVCCRDLQRTIRPSGKCSLLPTASVTHSPTLLFSLVPSPSEAQECPRSPLTPHSPPPRCCCRWGHSSAVVVASHGSEASRHTACRPPTDGRTRPPCPQKREQRQSIPSLPRAGPCA